METDINKEKIEEILNRGTIVEILPNKKEFKEILLSGKKMRFFIGFDATAPTLHLSHAKNLILLEKFRKLGHEVIVLFGDFTARIGDPTGEHSARKQLTDKDVIDNVKKWKELIVPLMDFNNKENPPNIMYNSKWLAKLFFEDVLSLASNFTVQQMLERDMFQKRLKEQKPIYMHEFLYPLMQGYDSVAMDVNVELCGTDQIFNAMVGRSLLKKLKGKEKFVVAVTLMENPKTGDLMSKSKGTGVFLDVSSKDMFGQVMAQPDEMIEILFVNCTYISMDNIKSINIIVNPMHAKLRLAFEITKIFHGENNAQKAKEEFEKVFSKKELPSEMQELVPAPLKNILMTSGVTSSMSAAQRLIEDGGVKVNNIVEKDWKREVKEGDIIKAGKRKFIKITVK